MHLPPATQIHKVGWSARKGSMGETEHAAQEIPAGSKHHSQAGIFDTGDKRVQAQRGQGLEEMKKPGTALNSARLCHRALSTLHSRTRDQREQQQQHLGHRQLYITVLTPCFKSQHCLSKLQHRVMKQPKPDVPCEILHK